VNFSGWSRITNQFLDSMSKSKFYNPFTKPNQISPKFAFLTLVWLVTVTGLTVAMIEYSNVPGALEEPPSNWPVNSQISLSKDQATLVLFAHPHCPCTIATLDELEKLLARCRGKVSSYVVLVRPANTSADWGETAIKRTASKIQGVKVVVDSAGILTKSFGCKTSGSALLYASDGTLLFQGGITLARGHSGDNAGRSAIQEILYGRKPELTNTPVFGCGLLDSMCTMGDVN